MELYTSTDCAPCKVLKKWIKDKGLDGIVERDVRINIEEANELGLRAVPALADGTTIILGDKIKPFLEKHYGIK